MQNKETAKIVSVRRQKSPIIYILATVFIVVLIVAGFWALKKRTDYVAYKNVKIGNQIFKLEVASSDATRSRGLSYRDSLPSNSGMLFDFKANGDWRIWMADMHFNIDIAWLSKDGKIVHIKSNATPGSFPEAYHADTPNWYVIEAPPGTFEVQNVHEGDTIDIR